MAFRWRKHRHSRSLIPMREKKFGLHRSWSRRLRSARVPGPRGRATARQQRGTRRPGRAAQCRMRRAFVGRLRPMGGEESNAFNRLDICNVPSSGNRRENSRQIFHVFKPFPRAAPQSFRISSTASRVRVAVCITAGGSAQGRMPRNRPRNDRIARVRRRARASSFGARPPRPRRPPIRDSDSASRRATSMMRPSMRE